MILPIQNLNFDFYNFSKRFKSFRILKINEINEIKIISYLKSINNLKFTMFSLIQLRKHLSIVAKEIYFKKINGLIQMNFREIGLEFKLFQKTFKLSCCNQLTFFLKKLKINVSKFKLNNILQTK